MNNQNNMQGPTNTNPNNNMMGGAPNTNNNMMGGAPNPNNNMMGNTPNANNNVMMGNTPNANAPKKNNTIIIIIAVVVVVLLVVLFFVFKGRKPKPDVEVENKIEESIKLEEKITVDGEKLPNGKIFLTVKNNNNSTIGVKVTANFYDESNNLVNTEDVFIYPLKPNSEKHGQIYLRSSKTNYDRFELKFKADDRSYYEFVDNDKLEIKNNVNKEEEEILLQVKNNAGIPVERVDVEAIFYKDNKVIGFSDETIDEIRVDETGAEKIMIPYDTNYDTIQYDNIKIFIYAYNTNFDD